jgi:hypothetical protein
MGGLVIQPVRNAVYRLEGGRLGVWAIDVVPPADLDPLVHIFITVQDGQLAPQLAADAAEIVGFLPPELQPTFGERRLDPQPAFHPNLLLLRHLLRLECDIHRERTPR